MSKQLPSHVLSEIDSPIREARLQAVDELTRIAFGADLAMAAAARHALHRMTADDSRSVAAAAAAGLERTGVRVRPDRIDFGEIAPGTPEMTANVLVEGPPIAVANATVTVAGPGLRAMLVDRSLHISWQPRSDWLDGSVTVRGPAGWAEVRVTGRVTAPDSLSSSVVEEWLSPADFAGGPGTSRMTVVRAPRGRRRAGATALIAGLTALVVLGGVGVAMALTDSYRKSPTTLAVAPEATPSTDAFAPAPATTLEREPLSARAASLDKPAVVTTVRVGNEPEGVAVSPDGRTVWVANQSSRVLSVVDVATRKVSSIQLRNTGRFVTASRDGRLIFVSMYESDMSGSGVAVVDAQARKVLRYWNTGVQPFTLAVGPDDRVWVPIHGEGQVETFEVDGKGLDSKVTVPRNPHAVDFSARYQRAFTANHESNAVAVIDMRTDKLLTTIPVSKAPHSVAVSPDGTKALVAGYEANTANLIDASTLKATGPIKVGRKPQSVAFARDNKHAYVVNEGDNTVSVLDGRTGEIASTVRVGRSPRTIAVSADGRMAYVSNGDDDTISVLQIGQ